VVIYIWPNSEEGKKRNLMMFNVHLSLLGWKEREALALINDGNIVNGYQSTSISTLKR